MTVTTLSVPSMTCGSCEQKIRSALAEAPGIDAIAVDLAAKTVTVAYHEDAAVPADRIAAAGFPVAGVVAEL